MLGEPKMSIVPVNLENSAQGLYVANNDIKFKAINALAEQLKKQDLPASFDLGLRPTDVDISLSEKEGYCEFTIDFFQINGERLVINTIKGDTRIVIQSEYKIGETVKIGQKIWLSWKAENVYLFDRATKKTLVL
jgi:ABC-type sugar transport system ATPase subunit